MSAELGAGDGDADRAGREPFEIGHGFVVGALERTRDRRSRGSSGNGGTEVVRSSDSSKRRLQETTQGAVGKESVVARRTLSTRASKSPRAACTDAVGPVSLKK